MNVAKRLVEKKLRKQERVNFILAWSSSIVRKVGNKFHYNFKVGMQAHPIGYMGMNFGSITHVQKHV